MMPNDFFSEFRAQLARKLERPLPGVTAHSRMASPRYKLLRQPDETTRQSAVLILFYPLEEKICFPLILRPEYDGVHSGQMAFPGGRLEPADRDLTETALREAQEEVGIRPPDVAVAGTLSPIYIAVSNSLVLPVVGTVGYRPDYRPDAREVAGIWEVSLPEIQDKRIVSEGRIPIRGGFVNAPYYDFHQQKIWGATAMIISELLEIIEH